jgi:hypothetical protein
MSTSPFYPQPPHLMVQVWTPRPPAEAFAAASRAVQASGATPAGAVQTAPAGLTFVWLSDLGDAVRRQDVDGDTYWQLVSGADTRIEVVRAAFVRDGEPVVVEYGPAPAGEVHPLIVATYAAGLDLPEDIREEADEVTARRTAEWSLALLSRMAADTGALYGTVTVEESMPTAAGLATGAELTGTPLVARALTDAAPDLLPALRAAMPDLQEIELPAGTLFAGDAPFRTDGGATVWADHAQDAQVGRLVGTAVNNMLGRHAEPR